MKISLIFLCMVIILNSAPIFCQETADLQGNDSANAGKRIEPLKYSVGMETGWDSPFGNGLFISYNFVPKLEASFGGGYFISGPKIGMGVRYFVGNVLDKETQNRFKPFLGSILSLSGGRAGVVIKDGNAEGSVNIPSEQIMHVFLGVDRNLTRQIRLYGEGGYGIRLDENKLTTTNQDIKDKAAIYTPGELMAALGMAYKF